MKNTLVYLLLALLLCSLAVILPAAAADNGKIAFTSYRDSNSEIYVMNADGTGQTRLTNNPTSDIEPAWSPDGTKIAFASDRDGEFEIYTMNADGTGQTRLTNKPSSNADPAWSPDGTKIAFISNRDSNIDIYMMNADGTGQTRLTNNPEWDESPAWSPDGTKIAFQSARDGNWEIYVMNADGTGQTRLTNAPDMDAGPDWSPDGMKIAFESDRDSIYNIYMMNADGTGQTRLTNAPNMDLYPAWSPDGTKIAFSSHRDDNWEIYVMNADGTGQTRLTNNLVDDMNPAWGVPSTNPLPTITSIVPPSANAGGPAFTLTVTGTGYIPTSKVRWKGMNRPTTYVSATQLTAAIPASDIATAGTAMVKVFNPAPGGGISRGKTFMISSAANPLPTITSIDPPSANAGGPAFTLTVTGTGYIPSSKVRWKGTDRPTTYVSATQLTAAIPASDIATAGTAMVNVYNPAPGGGTSNGKTFTISSQPVGGGKISGWVASGSADGYLPVPQAQILVATNIADLSVPGNRWQTTTDAQGMYTLEGLPTGVVLYIDVLSPASAPTMYQKRPIHYQINSGPLITCRFTNIPSMPPLAPGTPIQCNFILVQNPTYFI
jgi:Tol biopolymer transport system component